MASDTLFISKAPAIAKLLMADFKLTDVEAAAIIGNLGHESAGFRFLQEIKPLVPGSRGGYGWAQWTGSRRRDFEAYVKRYKLDPASDKANYGFLFVELTGSEKKAIPAVKKAAGLQAKVKAFENAFERAGVKHYVSRFVWAEKALTAIRADAAKIPIDSLAVPPRVLPPEPAPAKADANPVAAAAMEAAMGALTKEAEKTTNALSVVAIADATPKLEAAIEKAIAASPVVQNATNSEAHFWQKRTFWSTLASGGGAAIATINYFATNLPQDGRITLTFIGFALWAGYSAFRAGRAITPLGTPSQSRYPLNK